MKPRENFNLKEGNVSGSKQYSLRDSGVLVGPISFCCFLTLLSLSKQLVLSQYWANIIPIIGSILVTGRLPICCTNIGYTIIGCRYIGLWSQCQYCKWKPNIEPIWLDKRTPTPISSTGDQRWANIFMVSGLVQPLCAPTTGGVQGQGLPPPPTILTGKISSTHQGKLVDLREEERGRTKNKIKLKKEGKS